MTGISLFVVLLLLIAFGLARGRPLLGFGAAATAGGTVAVADLLKYFVLTRPNLSDQTSGGGNSFPSGHTSTAAACAMAFIIVCPPRWRGAAALATGGYASIVAAQVEVVGWHRPSDAIGGTLLAFTFASFVAGLVAWFRPAKLVKTKRRSPALVVLALEVVGAAVLSFVGLVYGFGALRGGASHIAIRHSAYIAGLAATVGVAAALVMTLVWLVQGVDLDTPTSLTP
jgi:hypothetical protein